MGAQTKHKEAFANGAMRTSLQAKVRLLHTAVDRDGTDVMAWLVS